MKQTINLLPPPAKKTQPGLSLTILCFTLALVVVFGLASSAYFWWQTRSFNHLAFLQQKENVSLELHMEELNQVVSERNLPSARENTALQLQQEIDAMSQMLQISRDISLHNNQGYLSLIDALHDNLPVNTKLESYKLLTNGKLDFIKGSADSALRVPQYIETLRNRGHLREQNISHMQSLNNADEFSFELIFLSQEDLQ